MDIKWEKLPERLYSEALKCLMCNIMKKYAKESTAIEGFIHCGVYMSYALATDNDEAFTKDAKFLLKNLDKYLFQKLDDPTRKEVDAYLKANHEYIRERVKEVLERATKCPDFGKKERS